MVNLVILLVINAFVVYGFYAITEYRLCNINDLQDKSINKIDSENSNILWFIAYYGDRLLPYWITKPLYNCPICMSSIWGHMPVLSHSLYFCSFLSLPDENLGVCSPLLNT